MTRPSTLPDRRVEIKIRGRRYWTDDAWLEPEERWGPEIKYVVEWRSFYRWSTLTVEAGQFAGGMDEPAETYEEAWRIADGWIRDAKDKGWEIGHD